MNWNDIFPGEPTFIKNYVQSVLLFSRGTFRTLGGAVIFPSELDQKCFCEATNAPNSCSAGATPGTPLRDFTTLPDPLIFWENFLFPFSITFDALTSSSPLENFLRPPTNKDSFGGNAALHFDVEHFDVERWEEFNLTLRGGVKH